MTYKRSKVTAKDIPFEFGCWTHFLKEQHPYIDFPEHFLGQTVSFKIQLNSLQLTKQYQPDFDYLEGSLITTIKRLDGTNNSISKNYPFQWEAINAKHNQFNPFRLIYAVARIPTKRDSSHYEILHGEHSYKTDEATFSLIAAAQNFLDHSAEMERLYKLTERTLLLNKHKPSDNPTIEAL